MRAFAGATLALSLSLATASGYGATLSLDATDYSIGTNVSRIVPGVTMAIVQAANIGAPGSDPSTYYAADAQRFVLGVANYYFAQAIRFEFTGDLANSITIEFLYKPYPLQGYPPGTATMAIDAYAADGRFLGQNTVFLDGPVGTGQFLSFTPSEPGRLFVARLLDGEAGAYIAQFEANTVPIPATVWLLGTALAGMGGRRWLRHKISS